MPESTLRRLSTIRAKNPLRRRFSKLHPPVSIAELRKLPGEEKLKIIEALWSDLAANEKSLESLAWHESTLRETAANHKAGRVKSLDWDEAKKELRQQLG